MGLSRHKLSIKSDNGFKLEEIELLELAAHFFLSELDKLKAVDIIHADIQISDSVLSEASSSHLSGDMVEIPNQLLENGRVGNYYVCRLADYTNSVETLRTLAHELIHVWQTENGSMQLVDGDWRWKGKSYGLRPYDGTEADDLLPWELEAAKLDLKLVRKFYKNYFSNW